MTLPFIAIGILNTLLLYGPKEGFMNCLWLIPALILCIILFKLHQIGGGDAKLILSVGALMGLEYTLIILLISFILGWFYSIYQLLKKTNNKKHNKKKKRGVKKIFFFKHATFLGCTEKRTLIFLQCPIHDQTKNGAGNHLTNSDCQHHKWNRKWYGISIF